MVWTKTPGIANEIVSKPGLLFASEMAWRKEPGPPSVVLITKKLLARANGVVREKTARMTANARLIRAVVAIFPGVGNAERRAGWMSSHYPQRTRTGQDYAGSQRRKSSSNTILLILLILP